MPPVILNAGIVIPKSSKMNFPKITKTVTIKKATQVALRLISLLVCLSASSTKEEKIGIFAIGFIMAKKPVKTERANGSKSGVKWLELE